MIVKELSKRTIFFVKITHNDQNIHEAILYTTPISNSIIPGLITIRIPIKPKNRDRILYFDIFSWNSSIAIIETKIGVLKVIAAFVSKGMR